MRYSIKKKSELQNTYRDCSSDFIFCRKTTFEQQEPTEPELTVPV